MYNRWMPPPDELYHHGVKGMKWGVRKQLDPAKAQRKLYKYEERYQKQIAKANKKLAKADKRATSYWYNEDEVISKYRSAARSKKKADKIARKGAKLYERMKSQLDDALFTEESTKLGQTFVDRVTAQSKETYLRSKKYT